MISSAPSLCRARAAHVDRLDAPRHDRRWRRPTWLFDHHQIVFHEASERTECEADHDQGERSVLGVADVEHQPPARKTEAENERTRDDRAD